LLYVEDNLANVRLMESMLRLVPDLRVVSAFNGEQGLELAQSLHPDLIILDINLPGMDGYAVMQHLQAMESCRHVPVLALSANAMPSDIARGKAAGFADYLTKPIKVEEFVEAIQMVLAQAK